MAKEEEEIQEQEGQEKKQKPQKPKKKGEAMSLPVLIGTIAGTIILLAVVMILAFKLFILPELTHSQSAEGNADSSSQKPEKIKEKKQGDEAEYDRLEDKFMGNENLHMLETGKILTNPKNSSKFAIVNLLIEYRISEEDERFADSEPNLENPTIKLLLANVKSEVTNILGSMTVDDFYRIGSDSLRNKIGNELDTIFRKKQFLLKDVLLTEYLIQ